MERALIATLLAFTAFGPARISAAPVVLPAHAWATGPTREPTIREAYYNAFNDALTRLACREAEDLLHREFREDFARDFVTFKSRYFTNTRDQCEPQGHRGFSCEVDGELRSDALKIEVMKRIDALFAGRARPLFALSAEKAEEPRQKYFVNQLRGAFESWGYQLLTDNAANEGIQNQSVEFGLGLAEVSFKNLDDPAAYDPYTQQLDGSLTVRFALCHLQSGRELGAVSVNVPGVERGLYAANLREQLTDHLGRGAAEQIACEVNAAVISFRPDDKTPRGRGEMPEGTTSQHEPGGFQEDRGMIGNEPVSSRGVLDQPTRGHEAPPKVRPEPSGPASLWRHLPEIIRAAGRSPRGILALMVVGVGVLAGLFFRLASLHIRILIFVLIFGGVAAFGAVAIHQQLPTDDARPMLAVYPTIHGPETPDPVTENLDEQDVTRTFQEALNATGRFRLFERDLRAVQAAHAERDFENPEARGDAAKDTKAYNVELIVQPFISDFRFHTDVEMVGCLPGKYWRHDSGRLDVVFKVLDTKSLQLKYQITRHADFDSLPSVVDETTGHPSSDFWMRMVGEISSGGAESIVSGESASESR